jgi:DNA-binding transcriptional ArsR family regulator
MVRELQHPLPEQISLSALYDALRDPVRRKIILKLSEEGELNCSRFLEHGTKANLSYHFARLREAGLTSMRLEGTLRYIDLRIDDLEARFPGLLAAVIDSVREEGRSGKTTAKSRKGKSRGAAGKRRT